jgi:hypothetical protein
LRRFAAPIAAAIVIGTPAAHANFHLSEIDEFMVAYDNNPAVQFVEIVMKSGGQNVVTGSKLATFDATGSFTGIALTVSSNVTSGADRRWLMATPGFQSVTGLDADFLFASALPVVGGMICWGKPGATESNPGSYVDCVTYGNYVGPGNIHTSAPNPLAPYGFSLRRSGDTDDTSTDFGCADPADPENNDLVTVDMPATTACSSGSTTTTTASPTTTTTLVGTPLCGDGNDDGNVTATDALFALNTSVGAGSCPLCRCDVDSSGGVTATDALRLLNAAVGVPVSLNCVTC